MQTRDMTDEQAQLALDVVTAIDARGIEHTMSGSLSRVTVGSVVIYDREDKV